MALSSGEAKILVRRLSVYTWKIATSDMYEKRCVIGLLMDHLLHHWCMVTVKWSLSRMCHHQSLEECYTLAICRCEVLIVDTLAQPLLVRAD